jgi:hypothetical protein
MSNSESPEFAALNELESVVRQLCDELATWRRRAHKAEGGGGDRPDASSAELQRRLDATRSRVQELLKRLRFLEEQANVHEVR